MMIFAVTVSILHRTVAKTIASAVSTTPTVIHSVLACLQMVAEVLGVRHHQVDVRVRRVGGGFGGKLTHNIKIAGMKLP